MAKYRYRDWYHWQLSGFRHTDQLKKYLSPEEVSLRAWKTSKRRDDRNWRPKPRKKWVKKHCNGLHRAWERDCLAHPERWDELIGWTGKRKDLFDPWYYD